MTVWRAGLTVLCVLLSGACAEADLEQQTETAMTEPLLDASIETLHAMMQSGKLSAADLAEYHLERIARYDKSGPALNAVQVVNASALADAQALDTERAQQGPRSLLHGIPVIVKDNYETMGMPTTAGSVLFDGHAPPRDAELVARLKNAGAVIIGKATMHEFAYGITTVGSNFGETKNPYDLSRNPGGSSGGTGAAVAANFATVGMGSDTCGSIRIPSAHNNLVGLRGTQGLASRRGIVPLSSTQDIGGPLARSVRDLAIVLDATVGFDAGDPQTAEAHGQETNYLANLSLRPGARIGVLTDWMVQESGDEAVAGVIADALAQMADARGWQITELPSPAVNEALNRPLNGHFVLIHDFKTDINTYLAANPGLGFADLGAMLADGRAHPNVKPSLEASAGMNEGSRAAYLEELAQRRVVRRALLSLMAEHGLDALAYPTIRRIADERGREQMGTNCRLAANSGLPAISVPAGFLDGMPVGLELLAERWSEQKLLDLAWTVESILGVRRPPASTP